MASRSLGTLTLDLVAKIGGFTAGMDKAARVTDKRMREMERRAQQFGKVLGTAIAGAATAAFAGLTIATKAAIDQADAMRDLSIRVGVSTETLSAYGYAAKQTGTDIDTLGKGMKILAKNAADALNPTSEQAKVFDALGIKVTDAGGKLKDMATLIPELADKFKSLENGTTKTALAQALLGKSGLDLIEFFNLGSSGLGDMTDKMRSLGIEIDQNTANAADNFNDTLGDLKAAVGGLGLGIARELLPSLQETVERLVKLITQGGLASDIATVLGASFSAATSILSGYAKSVQITSAAMEYMVKVGAAWLTIQKNMSTFGFADGTISGAVADIKKANAEGDAALEAIHNPKTAKVFGVNRNIPIDTPGTGIFANVNQSADQIQIKKLQDALANISAPKARGGGGAAKSGKSDATRQAEEAAKAARELLDAQQDYHSELLDIQADMAGPIAQTNREYDKAMSELEQKFQQGKVTLADYATAQDVLAEKRDKELAAIKAQRTPAQDLLSDMQAELDLIGMSNEERARAIALRYAGADATAAERQAIGDLAVTLERAHEAQAQIDDLKDASKDFFVDLTDGAGSAREAWDDFFDGIKRRALEFVADKVINQFFDMLSGKGSTGGGGGASGGGFWAGLLGLFGGGGGFGGAGSPLAGGGWTDPMKYHQVGEYDRPELLLKNGKQYLLPGDRGRVVPMSGGGGDFTFAPTFLLPQRVDSRTQQQISQRTGDAAREAMRRNSGR